MLPSDPIILLSWVNTQLRDRYSSRAALCDDLEEEEESLREKLAAAGFLYDAEQNRFR